MTQGIYKVLYNFNLAPCVFRMVLEGDTSALIAPGQFVNIKLEGKYLRRPISVCDFDSKTITIIYKVVGEGTEKMSKMACGAKLLVLTGLGNGYDLTKAGDTPLLVGGGVGVPPMYMLARQLREMGKSVKVILGFNTKDEVFYEEEFRALGCNVIVTTADGSHGIKGFVTNAMDGQQSYYYTCGPLPMIKALINTLGSNGEVSMEERMGCGFGACMGCTIQTTIGPKRVCKEGPVFPAEILQF